MTEQNELRAIGERLLIMAERGKADTIAAVAARSSADEDLFDDRYLGGMAQALYASRSLRERHMSSELFGEPAWDMLLDLFIRGTQGKKTSVTSLCVASRVPITTALRWVSTLQDSGLLLREDSELDRRVAYLKLSGEGFRAVRLYLIDAIRYLRPTQNSFLLGQRSEG